MKTIRITGRLELNFIEWAGNDLVTREVGKHSQSQVEKFLLSMGYTMKDHHNCGEVETTILYGRYIIGRYKRPTMVWVNEKNISIRIIESHYNSLGELQKKKQEKTLVQEYLDTIQVRSSTTPCLTCRALTKHRIETTLEQTAAECTICGRISTTSLLPVDTKPHPLLDAINNTPDKELSIKVNRGSESIDPLTKQTEKITVRVPAKERRIDIETVVVNPREIVNVQFKPYDDKKQNPVDKKSFGEWIQNKQEPILKELVGEYLRHCDYCRESTTHVYTHTNTSTHVECKGCGSNTLTMKR